MGKETTWRREACWYHSSTARRTGTSSCSNKVALLLCLWKAMTWSWLVPRATTIPAESHSLPSNAHSWLHGLWVDKEHLGGGHLSPQALSRSVPPMTFKPLAHTRVQTYCVPEMWMQDPCSTRVNLWEGQQLPKEKELQRESVREEVPLSYQSWKYLGKESTDIPEIFSHMFFSSVNRSEKERGNILLQLYAATSS